MAQPEPLAANLGRIRPPLVYLASIALGLVLHSLRPVRLVPARLGTALGVVITALSVALFVSAVRALRAAETPVPGNRPTMAIVRSGPYRVSRNPIYLAFSLLQVGLAFWINSLALLVTLLPAMALMSLVVIRREERYLESRFPAEYPPYKASVRRWLVLLGVVAALGPPTVLAQTGADKPNVLLVITDDMGYADLGVYGAPDVRTPNIDGLARDGVRFTSFYANGVLCSPTRAGLISGRYQQRYGVESALANEGSTGDDRGLPALGTSLPRLLKTSGYTTALIGKWHLGYRPEFSPSRHGFDHFFGLKSGYHDYYTHRNGTGMQDLWENDRRIEARGYTTDLVTERAVELIERNAARPFFIEVAYNAPHWPYQPPNRPSVAPGNARHVRPGDSVTSTRADYVAMVERVDRGVGELLAALDRLDLTRSTIVIFTNDNGGEWLSNGGPFFNRKWTVWEGGIRVPAIVRWPGRVAAGTVSEQVGITMDLTASILAATGTPVPEAARLEGVNLFPILEGQVPVVERTLFWRTSVGGQNQKAVRQGQWKLVVDGTHIFLFDIATDPGERHDLASRRQDVARSLRSLLADWERDVDEEAKRYQPEGQPAR